MSRSRRRDIGFLHALFGVKFNSQKKRPIKGPWYLKKNWSAWFKKNWLVFTEGDSNWQDCDQCGITLVCKDFRRRHQNCRRSSIIEVAEWEENIATLKNFVAWVSKSWVWWPSPLGNQQLEKEMSKRKEAEGPDSEYHVSREADLRGFRIPKQRVYYVHLCTMSLSPHTTSNIFLRGGLQIVWDGCWRTSGLCIKSFPSQRFSPLTCWKLLKKWNLRPVACETGVTGHGTC